MEEAVRVWAAHNLEEELGEADLNGLCLEILSSAADGRVKRRGAAAAKHPFCLRLPKDAAADAGGGGGGVLRELGVLPPQALVCTGAQGSALLPSELWRARHAPPAPAMICRRLVRVRGRERVSQRGRWARVVLACWS